MFMATNVYAFIIFGQIVYDISVIKAIIAAIISGRLVGTICQNL